MPSGGDPNRSLGGHRLHARHRAGETGDFEVRAFPGRRVLSLAATIPPTSDGFLALGSVPLPRRGSVTYHAVGHAAGSVTDGELCVHVPGPTCGEDGGSPEGEGFVHVSGGIHGIGDLPEEIYDWRDRAGEGGDHANSPTPDARPLADRSARLVFVP